MIFYFLLFCMLSHELVGMEPTDQPNLKTTDNAYPTNLYPLNTQKEACTQNQNPYSEASSPIIPTNEPQTPKKSVYFLNFTKKIASPFGRSDGESFNLSASGKEKIQYTIPFFSYIFGLHDEDDYTINLTEKDIFKTTNNPKPASLGKAISTFIKTQIQNIANQFSINNNKNIEPTVAECLFAYSSPQHLRAYTQDNDLESFNFAKNDLAKLFLAADNIDQHLWIFSKLNFRAKSVLRYHRLLCSRDNHDTDKEKYSAMFEFAYDYNKLVTNAYNQIFGYHRLVFRIGGFGIFVGILSLLSPSKHTLILIPSFLLCCHSDNSIKSINTAHDSFNAELSKLQAKYSSIR